MIKTTESMTADEFREIRKELGLTQDELAEVLGYHGGNHVSRIERGKTPVNKRSAIIMKRLRDHNRPR